MYAIIKTGGKQYKVAEGDKLYVEKLNAEPGSIVTVSEVLAVVKDGSIKAGNPLVEGAKVSLKVVRHGKSSKILVFKYKPKKNYRRKYGHRQPFTEVIVEKIEA